MQQPLPDWQTDSRETHDRARRTCAVAAIGILVGLAYANSLFNGFVFDDMPIIQRNPLIRELRHLPTLFTTDYWEGAGVAGELYSDALYRPLVLATYMFNYLTTGPAPWVFHLTNVVIHLGVVTALYGVARRLGLTEPGALAAALVFAVHPLNTETVTGIVGRAELLMALGVLLAFYWDLVKNPPEEPAAGISFASLAAFTLSLFSKEQAVMLPALVFFADGMRAHRSRSGYWQSFRRAHMRYPAYVLTLALYLSVRLNVVGTTMPPVPPIENPLSSVDLSTGLINAVKVAGLYLQLAVWPATLSADYSYNAIPMTQSVLAPAVWGAGLVWIALLAVGVVAFVKRHRPAAIGVAITLLFFLPVSNLFLLIGTVMGERLFYLPLAGLCLVLGAGVSAAHTALADKVQARWRTAITLGAAIFVLTPLTVRTIVRNRDWASAENLFGSIVRTHPENAKARYLLGNAHLRQKQLLSALASYKSALAIAPRYAHYISFARSYAGTLLKLGKVDEAIAALEEGVRMNTGVKDPWIHRLLAVAYEANKDYSAATASLQRAIEIGRGVSMMPTEAIFGDYNQLARLYALQQRNAASREALANALSAVRADAHLPEPQKAAMTAQILGNLALLDTAEGDYGAAENNYLRLLELLESQDFEISRQLRISHLREYARLLRKMRREERAAAIEREAAALEAR